MSEIKMSLAAARVNAGMTQEQAARAIGVCKSTIIHWEKGRVDVPFSAVVQLCELYGVSVGNIFVPFDLTESKGV